MIEMKCYVLTGISKSVIEEIMRGNVKTLELRSAHNVATALKVNVGDHIFITYAKIQDLDRGVSGLIAEIVGKEILTHTVIYSHMEECEMTAVRIRFLPKAFGRIVKVKPFEVLESREAEVVEVSMFDAR